MTDDRTMRIQQRAYEIWEREGRHPGRDMENWRQAEAEIARDDEEAARTIATMTGPARSSPAPTAPARERRQPDVRPEAGAVPTMAAAAAPPALAQASPSKPSSVTKAMKTQDATSIRGSARVRTMAAAPAVTAVPERETTTKRKT